LRAVPGHEDWHDIKEAFRAHKGFRYDERHLTVTAFDLLAEPEQRRLLGEETDRIAEELRGFLSE